MDQNLLLDYLNLSKSILLANGNAVGIKGGDGQGGDFQELLDKVQEAAQNPELPRSAENSSKPAQPVQKNEKPQDAQQPSESTDAAQKPQDAQDTQKSQEAQNPQDAQNAQDAQNTQNGQESGANDNLAPVGNEDLFLQDRMILAAIQAMQAQPAAVAEVEIPVQSGELAEVAQAVAPVVAETVMPQEMNLPRSGEEAVEPASQGQFLQVVQETAPDTEVIPVQPEAAAQQTETLSTQQGQGQVQAETQTVQTVETVAETPVEESAPVEVREAVADKAAPVSVERTVEHPQVETAPVVNREDTDAEENGQMAAASETGAKPLFQDVKAAPIKVADTPANEETAQTQNVETQLAGPLQEAVAQGQTKVVVQLNPESLGSVRVEITALENDNTLHIALFAQSSETRSLLEKHVFGLQQLLGNNGQNNVQIQVQREQEAQQNQQQNQNQNPYEGHNGNPHSQEQQQRRQQHQTANPQDFLQQLRLGLVPLEFD